MSTTETPTAPKPTAVASLLSMRKNNVTYRATDADLRAVETPAGTRTWSPIPHYTLLDHTLAACQERGLVVEKQEFSISRDRHQFFGVLVMRAGARKDFTLAMGLRNSTDKSMTAGIVSGAKVMVCDNLSLTGDIVIDRKHTPRIHHDLPILIRQALDGFVIKTEEQANVFDQWKQHQIPIEVATNIVVRACEAGMIPMYGIMPVRQEFIKPRHKEFEGGTVWTLYNAFTQYLTHDRAEVAPVKSQRDFLNMHQLILKDFPISN